MFRPALTALALVLALGLGAPAPARAEAVSVQGIAWDAEREAYVVKATGELAPRVTRLDSPPRLVIDLPGTTFGPSYQALEGAAGSGVTRVRVGQFQAQTTRVVLDLARPLKLDVEAGGHELVIPMARSQASGAVTTAPTIRAIRQSGGSIAVVMSRRAPYWSHVSPAEGPGKPVRYLLVFPNTRLAPGLVGTMPVSQRGIERVTALQAGSEARLELELSGPPTFDIQASATGWRFLAETPKEAPKVAARPAARPPARPAARPPARPAGKPAGKPTIPPPAETSPWANAPDAPLALRKVDGHWQMLLTADDRFRFKTTSVGDDRVHVDIQGGKVSLPRDSVYIDNGLIARVRVNPGASGGTRLTIDLDQPVRHTAKLMANQRSLLLGFHRVGKDRVTLDPGHGGSDAGTIGQKGTREKDVTLQIATRLARVMESNGMSVQMTRMKDLEILLRPRVEMANRNDADVFVSIHANSFGSQHGVNGIETYYFSDESYGLAKSIHKSLIKTLGRPDRGVRKNNFYVVHHTKMPAALVELGYLSNAEEEALLASPAYQERAAQAIYAGIKDFMATRKAQQH